MRPQATPPTPSAPSGPGRSAALTRSRSQNSPRRHSAGRENITKLPLLPLFSRKVPVELCGPAACGLVAGPTECYEKKVSFF